MLDQTLYLVSYGSYDQIPYVYGGNPETNYSTYKTDTYTMGNPTTRLGIITNVRVSFKGYARPSFSGAQYGKTAIYSAGRYLIYGSANALGDYPTGGTYYTDYALNPWTGVAWTWDNIDALQAGFSLISDSGESYAGSDPDQLKLIVSSIPLSSGGAQIIGLELL